MAIIREILRRRSSIFWSRVPGATFFVETGAETFVRGDDVVGVWVLDRGGCGEQRPGDALISPSPLAFAAGVFFLFLHPFFTEVFSFGTLAPVNLVHRYRRPGWKPPARGVRGSEFCGARTLGCPVGGLNFDCDRPWRSVGGRDSCRCSSFP